MSLSLTTRRKQQQTLSAKWSTQQHLAQHLNADVTATSTNLFRRHNHQPLPKQNSFIDNLHLNKNILTNHTGRAYLSRGLSVGRSQDTQRSSYSQQVFKKHSSIAAKTCNGKNEQDYSKTNLLKTKNITTYDKSKNANNKSQNLRTSRRVNAWSSTSSILKTLDKELAHLNGEGECKSFKISKEPTEFENNLKNKPRTYAKPAVNSQPSPKESPEVNKVNLNIVLSNALEVSKEEIDFPLSGQELDEEDSDDTENSSGNVIGTLSKSKYEKVSETSPNTTSRVTIPVQQRRSLYHTSRMTTNLISYNSSTTSINSGVTNSPNFNASPSLIVQKRPPLIRAMSAPVRGFAETAKGSTFFNTKRKTRRRKLNNQNLNFDKGSCNFLTAKDFNLDSKSTTNKKILTRSKSVAPDVVTLVSLISSEGSDSEKEENISITSSSHTGSPNKRAPSLRKSGKSVSFQENYPPTFQFSSKEYSHMLRRGSIATYAQRINLNRPPTAPAGSIYQATQNLCNEMPATNVEPIETKERNQDDLATNALSDKLIEDTYEFPEYVRSLKERECWKLFQKMSNKGVNITYDTILRGMLTPTEFRQLQKQREIEEAKALKEIVDNGLVEQNSKKSTAIERLRESLLKN